MISFKKIKEDEDDFYKYLWRIGTAIENGSAECTWSEAVDEINEVWGKDYTASAYRKPVQYAIPFYDHIFSKMDADDRVKEIQKQKDELYKVKKQLFDQRREYNKILTQEARDEHLMSIIKECAESLRANDLKYDCSHVEVIGDTEAVLCLSDWHYGMTTRNAFNTFNVDICKKRVAEVVRKATQVLSTHKVDKLHVVFLGDAIHGDVHASCRVSSEELACDQLMHASELIADLILELSNLVSDVEVYCTIGNHARIVSNKQDSVRDDNMERFIPWYLTERLKGRNINVNISDYNDMILFECCGKNIFATHGDIDKFNNIGVTANTLVSQTSGKTIDIAIAGDKHSAKEYNSYGIECIQVASLCGSDEYANNNRLYSTPGQTMMVFTPEDGRLCTYNITFTL